MSIEAITRGKSGFGRSGISPRPAGPPGRAAVALRRDLLLLLVHLYGVASSCGPAMHALPGFGADAEVSSPDKPLDTESARLTTSHVDCPVCHFLALGQLGIAPPGRWHWVAIQTCPTVAAPLDLPPATARTGRPRGPPRA